jgi:uncharacterized membrane protein
MPPLMEELQHDIHNKTIHFPIALSIAGLALMLFSRGRPGMESAARALVWGAAAFAVVAYFSGQAQEKQFDGRPKEWVVEVHEKWGIGTTIGLLAWGLITSWGAVRGLRVPWGVLIVMVMLVTAYLGGVVAHGH